MPTAYSSDMRPVTENCLVQPFWLPSDNGPTDEARGLFWVGARIGFHDPPRGSMENHGVDGVHDPVNTAITQDIDFSPWVVEAGERRRN